MITPVVGWLRNPAPFRPHPREVAGWFEVGLEELANPARFAHSGEHMIAGRAYTLPEYRVADRLIWGATARIIQNLLELWGK